MMRENTLQMNLIRAMKHSTPQVNVPSIALLTLEPRKLTQRLDTEKELTPSRF
jgi:hypothetical protein